MKNAQVHFYQSYAHNLSLFLKHGSMQAGIAVPPILIYGSKN